MTAPQFPAGADLVNDLARLAHARHELRTPVNAIIGYSELLLEDAADLDAAFAASLARLQALGKQLQALVGSVLDGERLRQGQPLDLTALTAAARDQLRPPGEEVGVVCAGLAARATEAALKPFAADVQRIAGAGQRLLALLDDPELLGPATAAAPAPAPAEPVAAVPAHDGVPPPDDAAWFEGMNGHVLVVDDNPLNRDMLARGLLRQKHHFALAENGRQALDMVATGAFDLVLLDILMPVMDGFETLARIKADPNTRHIPVIMISALDQLDGVVRCIEMGAEDYLPKPFNPVLLKARVGACLEKKRLRDQELEYLRNVASVTTAAAAVEGGSFDPDTLATVAARADSLGQLARVFQRMGREVQAREERLKMQVQKLRVEIDEVRKAKQVAEITETDYFQELQQKAQHLRKRTRPGQE
jgi:CheY-like chemotaxis protein